ncbi:MAG: TPM domain-containing protein [Bacteroidales bacterium]|nr:TPM domain-containing protein [Bacteroidales bacterium]
MKFYIKILFLTFSLIVSNSLLAKEFSINDIKSIKTKYSNSYVSNQDNILSASAVQIINDKLALLEKETSAQVAFVCLKSSGNMDAREVSMQLFDKWKVGQKESNNGLIIVLIVDRREVFLRTGYGLEGALTDSKATWIVNNIMGPYFKDAQWDKGAIEGINYISDLIVKEYNTYGFAQKKAKTLKDYIPYIYLYLGFTIILTIFAFSSIRKAEKKYSLSQKEEKISAFNSSARLWIYFGILFPIMDLFILLWYSLFFKPRVRFSSINCSKCNGKMHRLSEKEEDEYLSQRQLMEEEVRSKNYDVWLCENCQNTSVFAYENKLTKYSYCPYCNAKTMSLVEDRIIRDATSLVEGKGEKIYKCKNCGKTHAIPYVIPLLAAAVAMGSMGGFGKGGGGFSGGSFGGGFSGGGGGGGRF